MIQIHLSVSLILEISLVLRSFISSEIQKMCRITLVQKGPKRLCLPNAEFSLIQHHACWCSRRTEENQGRVVWRALSKSDGEGRLHNSLLPPHCSLWLESYRESAKYLKAKRFNLQCRSPIYAYVCGSLMFITMFFTANSVVKSHWLHLIGPSSLETLSDLRWFEGNGCIQIKTPTTALV